MVLGFRVIYIYIYSHPPPPPLDRPRSPGIVFPVCPGRGGGKAPLQNSSSFQNSKNPKTATPRFGFLETRAGASKSKNRAIPRVSRFQKSKKIHPKVWFFGNSSGSLKIQNSRVSNIPNLGVDFFGIWNFGNSRNLLDFWILRTFLEFPKFQKPKNSSPSFGFLETRAGASKSKNRANSLSFQNSKPWGGFFGILETRGICSIFGFWANSSSFQNSKPWGGFLETGVLIRFFQGFHTHDRYVPRPYTLNL